MTRRRCLAAHFTVKKRALRLRKSDADSKHFLWPTCFACSASNQFNRFSSTSELLLVGAVRIDASFFTTGDDMMSDNKSGSRSVELITKLMNDLARKLGTMDPDDSRGDAIAAELSQLMQLKRSVRLASDPVIGHCMDELARVMATLK